MSTFPIFDLSIFHYSNAVAIAHICLSCGFDMARVRPATDPHCRLPLVICPRCDHACVRRRHPIWIAWRSFLRLKTALLAMLLHLIVLMFLMIFNIAGLYASRIFHDNPLQLAFDEDRSTIILSFVVVPILTGAWLSSGLAHVPRWRVWVGWTLCVGFLASFLELMNFLEQLIDIPGRWAIHDPFLIERWMYRMKALPVMMLIAVLGIPIGQRLQRSYARHRTHHWRKRRRRMRARRTAA